jgi:uncharacterized protein (TIGR03437 family)
MTIRRLLTGLASLVKFAVGIRVNPRGGRMAIVARSGFAIFAVSQAFAQSGRLTLTCAPASPAQVGVNYTNNCSITGGTPPYQWRVDFLPLGLTYKTAATIPVSTIPPTTTPIAIQITGVPAIAEAYAYRVSVTDSATLGTQSANQSVTGTIATATQGPVISGIFGAGLSNPPVTQVTPDGLITIFGANLTPGIVHSLQNSDLVGGNSLPTNMAQICVRIGGILAPLLYVSPTQINAQVPDLPPIENVDVSVVTNCAATNEAATQPVNVSLAASAPEFLAYVQNPNGQDSVAAVGPFGNSIASPGLIPGVEVEVAGSNEMIAIFGIGFGATSTPVPAGMWSAGADPTVGTPTVMIGDHQAKVLYAGLAPGLAGIYQVNVVVPQTILTGNQPISIQVNGGASPQGAFLPTAGFDLQGSAGIARFTVTASDPSIAVGQTAQLTWQAENFVGFQLTFLTPVAWISSNPQVAYVSASGQVIGVTPGTATITALLAGASARTTIMVTSAQ